jgi:hypothetical protein
MTGLTGNLRIGVGVWWIVSWNVLFGLAFWINGGLVLPWRSHVAQSLVAVAFFGTALFSLAIAYVPSVTSWALKPNAQISVIRKDLWFIAFLTAAIGLGMSLPFIGASSV